MPPASGADDAAPPPSTAPPPGDPSGSPSPAGPPGSPSSPSQPRPPNSAASPARAPASLPGPSGRPDPVLAAERDHLRRSREFLRLMREDVLGLEAMAGDRVSQEYLKADLYHRAQALRDIPDVPLFFGRLDYAEGVVMNPGTFPAETGPPEPAGQRRRRGRRGGPASAGAAGRTAAHRAPSHP